ncbi:putative ABC transport system permease protein [Bryocella elongata]|uniref:Putative ABC transport system permease protein n=1 Tax=Bryocella elongata TaxID=863522 RepID=A0A1H6AA26_9BACT|nr:FtsX-like permease family protein [Bryocella elongata]SEG45593.1 putative ABC transport system permease protein [Bryocella elongata]
MNKLIVGNLVHRPLRSMISAFAVAIEVVMILSIAGVMFGILNGSRTQTTGIGMDMIVRPGAGGTLANLSAAAADIRVADVLRGLPHVQVVAPSNIKLTVSSNVENIAGIDFATYNALRPFVFLEGGPFQQPLDVIIDDLQARSGKGTRVGDKIKILGKDFTVCGIVEHGKGSRKFIPLTTMDDLDGTPNRAALFYLKTEDSPKFQEEVRKEILATDGLGDYQVQTAEEYLSMLTPEHVPAFNIGLRVVIGIAVVIGFLVIFQSMYTAVMERTREIGILKSMGAGKIDIVSVVLRETGILASVGVILGVGATYVLRSVLHNRFPTLSFQVTPGWVAGAVCIAMCGALLGALYPAAKAAAKDPIDALSYE